MMRRLRDKFVALIMLIVFLFYVGYRIYETKSDAAALQVRKIIRNMVADETGTSSRRGALPRVGADRLRQNLD